jgi:hypothetical protein
MTPVYLSPELSLSELTRRIAASLSRASWPGLRRLKLEARAGTIHVEGDVTTFFEKQQAYQWVRRLAGEVPVVESIAVVSRRQPRLATAGPAMGRSLLKPA